MSFETRNIVQMQIQHHSFKGSVPFMVGGIYSAIDFENAMHEAGLPWRSVHDRVGPNDDPDDVDYFPRGRRFLTFVRQKDLEAARAIAEAQGRRKADSLPVEYLGNTMCSSSHDYEIMPCSYCSTGWDWMAKADEAENEQIPPRHPNSSLAELES